MICPGATNTTVDKIGTDSVAEPVTNCGVKNGTAIVGSYLPNAWGLFDVYGCVWEWCLDWYADDITALDGIVNTTSGTTRVRWGGRWRHEGFYCRSACRYNDIPTTRIHYIGFRVACTVGLH